MDFCVIIKRSFSSAQNSHFFVGVERGDLY